MFGEDIFDEVYRIIDVWTPKQEYPMEEGYRDELATHLRKELNERGDSIFGSSRNHKIKKEHGRSLADIAIDESIGIELKRNLKKKADIDRLEGQVKRFRKEYRDGVIILLCGKPSEEAVDEVREMQADSGFLDEGPPVIMIRTDVESKKSQGLFGSGSLF